MHVYSLYSPQTHLDDILALRSQLRSEDSRRSISSHASSIWALIIVIHPLVVLSSHMRNIFNSYRRMRIEMDK
jgi:hypothetical protein